MKLPEIPMPPTEVKADPAVWRFANELFSVFNERERILKEKIARLESPKLSSEDRLDRALDDARDALDVIGKTAEEEAKLLGDALHALIDAVEADRKQRSMLLLLLGSEAKR